MFKLPSVTRLTKLPLRIHAEADLNQQDVRAARTYIQEWWRQAERYNNKRKASLIGLPEPYIIPSFKAMQGFDYEEQYYWDSYFIAQGLLDGRHNSLVSGMLENLMAMFKHYGVIPNASRTYLTGHSQPPFLTSFILDVYASLDPGTTWLEESIAVAKREYENVWMGVKKPNYRRVYHGLSRYYDVNLLNDLAEAESGWDMTPRFNRRALDYLPVDLNALLYKYETDFAKVARMLGKNSEAAKWDKAAQTRTTAMNKLMWDKSRQLYLDYDYVHKRRGSIASLATYFPMWAGMVSEAQAAALVRNLMQFEKRAGLVTTELKPRVLPRKASVRMQWAYPNGWAPLQFIVIQALERYGYHADAKRIAMKWLRGNLQWFNTHHEFIEKYNVVHPQKPPYEGVYPSQTGFGWTNAIFERLCKDYIDAVSTS